MSDKPLTVEFKAAVARRPEPTPKPEPGAKAERLQVDRAARGSRQLALALHIDSLIRSGQVANLAEMARLCCVSRARISKLMTVLRAPVAEQEVAMRHANLDA